jgi:hypothetical protein
MAALLKRFWSVLAVLAGLALIFFEYRRSGGITGENAFWLFVGAMVVVLGTLNLFQVGAGADESDNGPLGD